MNKKISFLALVVVMAACSPALSPDHNWNDRKWTLVEIKGMPVQLSGTEKDAHLRFSPGDKTFSGTGGCNRITGTYTIDKNNKINFGEPAATKMMCPDLAFETNFITTLKSVDSYSIEDNNMLLKNGSQVVMKLK